MITETHWVNSKLYTVIKAEVCIIRNVKVRFDVTAFMINISVYVFCFYASLYFDHKSTDPRTLSKT